MEEKVILMNKEEKEFFNSKDIKPKTKKLFKKRHELMMKLGLKLEDINKGKYKFQNEI